MAHKHWEGIHPTLGEAPTCTYTTKKACDNNYADWLAMQEVMLAYIIVSKDRAKAYRKDKGTLAQLVRLLLGEQEFILNGDGNPSEAPGVRRLYAAIERVKAGDLPSYTLYKWPDVPAEQEA